MTKQNPNSNWPGGVNRADPNWTGRTPRQSLYRDQHDFPQEREPSWAFQAALGALLAAAFLLSLFL